MSAVMELRLRDGRCVDISGLHFAEAYLGLISGRPSDWPNREYVEHACRRARAMWGERATHVVALAMRTDEDGAVRLPNIACAAWLRSAPLSNEFAGSQLVVIWWQEDLRGSLFEMLQTALGDLDWNALAEDFDP